MTPTAATRALTAIAALLLGASLGLPWGVRQVQAGIAPMPFTIQLWNGVGGGYCCLTTVPTYDLGRMPTTQVVTGAQHPARFGLVAALGLLLVGGRRWRRWVGGLLVLELLLSGSAGFTVSGVAAAWMSVLLLWATPVRRRPLPA